MQHSAQPARQTSHAPLLRSASAVAESTIWSSFRSAAFQAGDEGVFTTVSLADWRDGVEWTAAMSSLKAGNPERGLEAGPTKQA